LLLLSMLQHESGAWSWGRYVVVHPVGNTDFAALCGRYRGLLANQWSFSSMTVEEVIAVDPLPAATRRALSRRYLPGDAL